MDKNGNGFVSAAEFGVAIKELLPGMQLSKGVIDKLIKKADRNGDGWVDYSEFAAQLGAPQSEKAAKAAVAVALQVQTVLLSAIG